MEVTLVGFMYGSDVRDIVPLNAQKMKDCLSLFEKGSKVVITVKTYQRKRELSQNDALHAMFMQISKHSGESFNRVKRIMKEEYGLWVPRLDRNGNIAEIKGNIQYVTKNTTDYTVEEMSEFLEKVKAFSENFLNNKLPEIDFFRKYNFEI